MISRHLDRPTRHRFPSSSLGLLLLLGLISIALAAPHPSPEAAAKAFRPDAIQHDSTRQTWFTDTIGGAATSVVVRGNVAYASIGARLLAIDISDPIAPHVISPGGQLAGIGRDIFLHEPDSMAWLRLGQHGIQGVDLNAPEPPCCQYGGNTSVMTIQGDYLYSTSYNPDPPMTFLNVLRIDGRQPPTRVYSGYVDRAWESACSHAAATTRLLFLRCPGSPGLRVYSLEDPAEPQALPGIELEPGPKDLLAAGEHLFVINEQGLKVFEANAASGPSLIGQLDLPGGRHLAIDGQHLVVLDLSASAHLIDISDLASPRPIGSVPLLDSGEIPEPMGVGLSTNLVVAALGKGGIRLARITAEGGAQRLGRLASFEASAVAASEDAIVTVTGDDRLLSMTTERDYPLSIAGEMPIAGHVQAVAMRGSLAYLIEQSTSGSYILWIIDLARKAEPSTIGGLPLADPAEAIALADTTRLVLAGGGSNARIVDVADPSRPRLEAEIEDTRKIIGLAASLDHLYLSEWAGEYPQEGFGQLRVYSLADPGRPAELVRLTVKQPGDLALSGDRLFLVAESLPGGSTVAQLGAMGRGEPIPPATAPPETSLRLHELDVSKPAQPMLLRSLRIPGGNPGPTDLGRLLIDGEHIYLQYTWAWGPDYRSIAIFHDGGAAGGISLPSAGGGPMAASGGNLYVANGEAGLLALRPGRIMTPSPPGDPAAVRYLPQLRRH